MAEQETRRYHPITQATAAWQDFAEAMVADAIQAANVRESREKQRRDHSAGLRAAGYPAEGTTP